MNKKTASSAEIVVLSFKGVENVPYFERNSASYITVNRSFRLYDAYQLNLKISKLVDGEVKTYENQLLKPDSYADDSVNEIKT